MIRPAQRRALAVKAVAMKGGSIALACRAFDVSETWYRYSPKLLGLTTAKKTWGFGLCFSVPAQCPRPWLELQARLPDLPRVGAEPADQAAQAPEAGKARCAGGSGGCE
jgi:hypothetical protein